MQTIKEKLLVCASSSDDSIVSVTLGQLRELVAETGSAFAHGVIEGRRYPTGQVMNPYDGTLTAAPGRTVRLRRGSPAQLTAEDQAADDGLASELAGSARCP